MPSYLCASDCTCLRHTKSGNRINSCLGSRCLEGCTCGRHIRSHWVGDSVSYSAAHGRAQSTLPYICSFEDETCKGQLECALRKDAPEEFIKVAGGLKYFSGGSSLDGYIRLCASHHRRYDNTAGGHNKGESHTKESRAKMSIAQNTRNKLLHSEFEDLYASVVRQVCEDLSSVSKVTLKSVSRGSGISYKSIRKSAALRQVVSEFSDSKPLKRVNI